MPGGEAGALADLLVGEPFRELQAEELTVPRGEGLHQEPHQADSLPSGDLFVGEGLGVGWVV